MAERREQEFQTVNLNLASAILAGVPHSRLGSITPEPTVDGKRLISILYLPQQEKIVNQIVEEFQQRRLSVSLYEFNKALNLVRDRLLERTNRHQNLATDSRIARRWRDGRKDCGSYTNDQT